MHSIKNEFNEIKIISSLFWYIATTFVSVFVGFILYYTTNIDIIKNDDLLYVMSSILFVIVLFYKFKVTKNKLKSLINNFISSLNIKELISIVITQLFISMGISLFLMGTLYFILPNFLNNLLSSSLPSKPTTYCSLIISMMSTVVCAPIMEELLFRAIIFKRIAKKFNIYVGMIISSFIFAILHSELSVVGAFIFGIACCILYSKYKNILFPITIHFLNNFVAFLPNLNIDNHTTESSINNLDAILSIILGLLILIISLYSFIRFIQNNKKYLKSSCIANSN